MIFTFLIISLVSLLEIAAGADNSSQPTSPTSTDGGGSKDKVEEKPDRPPIPIRVSSRQPEMPSVEQLEKEYVDIARYKIFQLAGIVTLF